LSIHIVTILNPHFFLQLGSSLLGGV
jgi:hypothetical protein